MRQFTVSLIVSAIVLGSNLTSAFAASGWINGSITFESTQGNYCDTTLGMDCTGSRFTAAVAVGQQPIKDAEIHVLVGTETKPIGTGYTDRAGVFSVFWERATTPESVNLKVVWKQRDNRFRVVDASDAQYVSDITSTTPLDGMTKDIGPWEFPFSEPNNIYDASERTWTEALGTTARMESLFTDVRVRWPATGIASQAGTIDGANKIALLGPNVATRPQTTVSHELGHIASYLSKPYMFCGRFDYAYTCPGAAGGDCSPGHSIDTPEHACAGFEEGLAEFLADASYYWFDAIDPRTCISDSPCNTGFQIEASLGSSCTMDQSRQELQVERYIWDAYDQTADPGFTDSTSYTYFTMIDALAEMGTGTDNSQAVNDEPWDDAHTTVDDLDGRSARDFRSMLENAGDPSTADLYTNNCTPPGD